MWAVLIHSLIIVLGALTIIAASIYLFAIAWVPSLNYLIPNLTADKLLEFKIFSAYLVLFLVQIGAMATSQTYKNISLKVFTKFFKLVGLLFKPIVLLASAIEKTYTRVLNKFCNRI